jgi:hypothetical protein
VTAGGGICARRPACGLRRLDPSAGRGRPHEHPQQVADRPLLDEGVAERTLAHDLVAVPPAVSLAQHVALVDELGEDPVGGPLGDADRGGDVAKADPGIIGDAGEDVGVVCQKVPAGRGYLGNADASF